MTREELKTSTTEKLISALKYCGRDSYYATYYDEVVDEITKRLKQNKELQEENKKVYQRMTMLDKVLDYKNEQIERMKCGQNCKHSYLYQEDRKCKFTYCDCINCKDKWELAE